MSASSQIEHKYPSNVRARRNVNDFMFGKLIGEGSFSVVYLAKDIHTSKEWAVKVCEKQQIIRERKQEYVKREREALNRLSGLPGFLNLFCTFQDSTKLYFVMTYARKGNLLQLMEKVKKFDVECVRYYSAQILHAMEQMHAHSIIHRDLKPENILLDEKLHVMIADFGSSRIDDNKKDNFSSDEVDESASESDEQSSKPHRKRGSFVGTAQYVSPEILKGRDSTVASDLWSFGCMVYQMVAGFPPFQGPNDYLIFQKITKLDLTFPNDFDHVAADLIGKILVLNPQNRIGVQDSSPYDSIRNHKFLEGIDFFTLRKMSPPFLISTLLSGECTKEDFSIDTYEFPDNIKPGLDNEQITRLLGQDWLKIGAPSVETSSSSVENTT
ncbi:3-phosphoinositide-dependent protein kinase 1-like isoform X2 [Ochlerotatus camptorhynchus]|uniref:3-phosphoinositide-dependent protein kinase 1-like isoform X2 n=1 Tax=Ochlerotatus camptorhynchus TaxID=644619 RepID=UPI0031DDF755